MKKIVAIFLIAMTAFVLSGCSVTADSIKELKLAEDGSKVNEIEDIEDWVTEFEEKIEDYYKGEVVEKG